VVEDGAPVGLLPFKALASIPRSEWESRHVADSMLPLSCVPVLRPDTLVVEVLPELGGSEVRRALVVEDGRLRGILSIVDLLRALEIGGPPGRRPPG
jgi:predicted transcriptional regulator